MAAKINLMIETGVTFTKTFLWKNADGTRKSLTGLRAKMQIRKKPGSPILAEISSTDGYIQIEAVAIDGDTQGTFTITLPGPLTAPIKEPTATYDIRFETVATTDHEPSYRPVDGDIEFDLAVTK